MIENLQGILENGRDGGGGVGEGREQQISRFVLKNQTFSLVNVENAIDYVFGFLYSLAPPMGEMF